MLDLDAIDVEEIANALADQTDYEHRWLIDPRTGEHDVFGNDVHVCASARWVRGAQEQM